MDAFGMGGQNEAMTQMPGLNEKLYIPPTLRARLQAQREQFAKRLADIDEAIKGLDASPEVEKLLNLIQKVT